MGAKRTLRLDKLRELSIAVWHMVAARTRWVGGSVQCKAGSSGVHRRTTMKIPAKSAQKTKSAIITLMLSRAKGATLDEIGNTTGWKQHSCRAFLSGVRKTGVTLTKEERTDGKTAYRITTKVDAGQCPA